MRSRSIRTQIWSELFMSVEVFVYFLVVLGIRVLQVWLILENNAKSRILYFLHFTFYLLMMFVRLIFWRFIFKNFPILAVQHLKLEFSLLDGGDFIYRRWRRFAKANYVCDVERIQFSWISGFKNSVRIFVGLVDSIQRRTGLKTLFFINRSILVWLLIRWGILNLIKLFHVDGSYHKGFTILGESFWFCEIPLTVSTITDSSIGYILSFVRLFLACVWFLYMRFFLRLNNFLFFNGSLTIWLWFLRMAKTNFTAFPSLNLLLDCVDVWVFAFTLNAWASLGFV